MEAKIFVAEFKAAKGLFALDVVPLGLLEFEPKLYPFEGGALNPNAVCNSDLLRLEDPKLKSFPVEGAGFDVSVGLFPKLNVGLDGCVAGFVSDPPKLKLVAVVFEVGIEALPNVFEGTLRESLPPILKELAPELKPNDPFLLSGSFSLGADPKENPKLVGLIEGTSELSSFLGSTFSASDLLDAEEPKLNVANGLLVLGGGINEAELLIDVSVEDFSSALTADVSTLSPPKLNPLKPDGAGSLVVPVDVGIELPKLNEGVDSFVLGVDNFGGLPKLKAGGAVSFSIETDGFIPFPKLKGDTLSSVFPKLKPDKAGVFVITGLVAAAAFKLSIFDFEDSLSISSSFFCSSSCFCNKASLVVRSRVSFSSSATRALSFSVSKRSDSSFFLASFI